MITANSSGGAFSAISNSAPYSSQLGTLAHHHKIYAEGIYCTRGRFVAYVQPAPEGEKQARLLTQGDFVLVSPNAIHTYRVLDPDFQLLGVAAPGGIERAFLATSSETYDSGAGSPFPPAEAASPHLDPAVLSALASEDAYWAGPDYAVAAVAAADAQGGLLLGGDGGEGARPRWHDGADDLPPGGGGASYFVARGWGPKHLHGEGGAYKIIAPLVTPRQTGRNYHFGKLTLSRMLPNQTAAAVSYSQHTAFQVEDGRLEVNVTGFQTVSVSNAISPP